MEKKKKDNTNRWRDISCSWIGRISTVKMTIQHKATYRVNAIPIKLAMMSFPRTSTKIFSICMETQKTLNNLTKAVLTKKNGTGGTNFPDFRLYYRTPENKTVWYWHKN